MAGQRRAGRQGRRPDHRRRPHDDRRDLHDPGDRQRHLPDPEAERAHARAPQGAAERHAGDRAPATSPQSTAKIGIDPPGYEPPAPCPIPTQTPLFAWDAKTGDTLRDWSSYGRDGLLGGGAATYLATGPTGSAATSAARATCAPRRPRSASCARRPGRPTSRSTPAPPTGGSGTGRPASGGDDVGFLIDLTPTGQVRIITSGRGVTTNAVPPTGRFINLVITAGRDGNARRLRRRHPHRRRLAPGPRHQRLRAGRAALRRRPGRRPAHQRRARPHRDVHQGALADRPRALAVAGVRGRRQRARSTIGGTVPQVLGLTLSSAHREPRRRSPRASPTTTRRR